MGKILSINISEKKGTVKMPVKSAILQEGYGLAGDAHGGNWHRQVSLLDIESIRMMRGISCGINAGDFAENITTEDIELEQLKIGDILKIGTAVIEVTQIGKECHNYCEIKKKVGECIMPKRGVFTRILKGGEIFTGDEISLLPVINVGVLTTSDKGVKGEREDKSGEAIRDMIKLINGKVAKYEILPDEIDVIAETLAAWSEPCERIDVIFTTGGTGFSKRDVTPEATLKVIQKQVPGISGAIRREGCKHNPRAILSRGLSGIRNNTLIVNLPGSVKGVEESLNAILGTITHGIEILKGEAAECGND